MISSEYLLKMGGGAKYSQEEVREIAKVIMARPDGQHGPVFWERLASEGLLAPVLMARIMTGGDLAKFVNRHRPELMLMVEEEMKKRRLEVVVVDLDLAEGRHLIV